MGKKIRIRPNYTRISSSSISDGLRRAKKVVTFEETYHNEVPMEDTRCFFFQKKIKVCYVGKIIGGFDLRKAWFDGTEIILPEPEIFSNEIIKRYTVFKEESIFNEFTEEDINFLEEKGKRLHEKKVYSELLGEDSMRIINMRVNDIIGDISMRERQCDNRIVGFGGTVNRGRNSAVPLLSFFGELFKKLFGSFDDDNYREPERLAWKERDGNDYGEPKRLTWDEHDGNDYRGPKRLPWDSNRDGNNYRGTGRLTWDSRDDDDRYDKYWRH